METVSAEVPGPPNHVNGTLAGLTETVGPMGEIVAAKPTLPAKPLMLVNVRV